MKTHLYLGAIKQLRLLIGNVLPRREREVDQSDLGRRLGRVVRIGQFCGDVELEVLVVWNDGVSQLDHWASLLPEYLQNSQQVQSVTSFIRMKIWM